MRNLELLLLLFQTPRRGNKPLVGIMFPLAPVRCDVIRIVIFDGVGLFGLILRVTLVGRWFTLLYRWVYMTAVSAEAGFGAASMTLVSRLLPQGVIFRCLIAIVFFRGVHHINII